MEDQEIKKFYSNYADKIQEKRLNSPYVLRRYLHEQTYFTNLKYIQAGQKVLEIGCGEGILAVLMAKKGAIVTAVDISEKNLEAAKELANKERVKIEFIKADVENLSFQENSFDVVVADNVLEHLPNFEKGLSEIKRVSKKYAVIALPTCFNFCAWALLGGDVYWKITRRTSYAVFVGLFRFLFNLIIGKKGVNENYGGVKDLPHLWRYPWIMRKDMRRAGFKIVAFEGATLCFPYFSFLLPLIKFLDKYKDKPILRNFGCGSTVYLKK
jgi:2-polyprenyl-3-methyl-5-hydroxy-6-metoxy-1,4-benzoquinol methylase